MNTFKNILCIMTALIIVAGMLFLFFVFTLPALQQDREQLVKQEMEEHNQTLEMIKQDFSYVLSDKNISVEMNQNINLTISGAECNLKVTLNRELQVLSLETVDKTEEKFVGPIFACIGEGAALIFAIVWIGFTISDIAFDIKSAVSVRKARKIAKKQSVDVEVIV